ncbi:glycosyltransferase [Mobilicoccus pelagius]|uniref:glycosyltransferase n=1 Tax=Mobilicoccus pelagius TaxID=746032 RepID=UPI00145EFFEE|nr:glycosyltransferase [Mobilicoccus pelagius]
MSVEIPAHTVNATPFVARLVEAGHRVLWYCDPAFHAHARRHGAEPLSPSRAAPTAVRFDGLRDIRAAFARAFVGEAARRCGDLRGVIEAEGVDVVLTDALAFGAGMSAESCGVAWASFGDGPLHYAERDTPPFGTGLPYVTGWPWDLRNVVVSAVTRLVFAGSARRLARARRACGLSPLRGSVLTANLSPMLHLHGATPGFEYPRRRLPAQVRWVGALRPVGAPWQPPPWWTERADRPVVLVSQGTIRDDPTELLVPTLRGLADLDVTVLATTGSAGVEAVRDACGGTMPENAIVVPFAPYDAVLPDVDVFVTNGGWTGVTLALAHGVPLVHAGVTEEKADIGARVMYSGTGVVLRTSRPTATQVHRAVTAVLGDSPYRAAAARLAEEMAGHDAGREGADLLVRLVREGSVPPH